MRQRKGRRHTVSKSRYGYFFIAPFFIVFAIFSLYPILYTIFLSFQSWDGLGPVNSVGVKNYERLLKDEVFYQSLFNTFRMWMMNFIPQILLSLIHI